jgi:hypothetical protein
LIARFAGNEVGEGLEYRVKPEGRHPVSTTINPAEQHLAKTISNAERSDVPFRHWNLTQALPQDAIDAMISLAVAPPAMEDFAGQRAAVNKQRFFLVSSENFRHPACADLAAAFQSPATVGALSKLCDLDMNGSYLRLEYCQDVDGFWLEPHTDIGAKLFSAQIYLSNSPEASEWGTDFLDKDHNLALRTSGAYNTGHIFIPGNDTWHAFGRRKINGVRRSLIINYVKPEWRSRHELAFPEQTVHS